MATDTANVQSETANAGTVLHESDVEQVHLTQSGEPVVVQVPQGENVVRIQVTPGETIQLPFPIDAVVARLGDNGNLAVKVGDITVILLGYAEATGQAEVTIVGTDARPMDVAAVLAATDPNLDIQTAAGPGAGDQGAGPDNNGGLFAPFDPAGGIGGLDAVGGLGQTNLNYNLVQREFPELIEADVAAVLPDTEPVILSVTSAFVNEDDFQRYNDFFEAFGPISSGVNNGNDIRDTDDHEDDDGDGQSEPGDNFFGLDFDKEPTTSLVRVTVDFQGDVPGTLNLLDSGLPQDWTSNGFPVVWLLASDGQTLYGVTFPDGESEPPHTVVWIRVQTASSDSVFDVTVTLVDRLDHPDAGASPNVQDELLAHIQFEVVDSDGSTAAGAFDTTFKDDVPFIGYPVGEQINDSLGNESLSLVTDEISEGEECPDASEAKSGGEGGSSVYGSFGPLFYGADGPWDGNPNSDEEPESPGVLALRVVDPETGDVYLDTADLASSQLTSGNVAIEISQSYDPALRIVTLTGHTGDLNDPVFVIVLHVDDVSNDFNSGNFTVTFFKPLDHPDAGADGAETGSQDEFRFDMTLTVKDDDGDTAEAQASVCYSDDGPSIVSNALVQLDDDVFSGNPDGVDDDVDASNLTGTLGHEYGADGAGTTLLTGATLPATGGFTQDVSLDGLTLTISQNGTPVLQVQLTDATSGDYTVTQLAVIDHPAGFDENNVEFTLAYQVTDSDGDTVDGTMAINVDDDTPIANDDYDSVANLLTTDGNVISGVGTSDPVNGADKPGADGAAVSAIASQGVPANTSNPVTDVVHGDGFAIAGEHGTLTIYADGYYSYTRSNSDPLIGDDKFTYTLTDGDSDSDPATLTINIYDQGTELDLDPTGEDAQSVHEKGLPTRTIGSVVEPAGTGEAADDNGSDDDDTSERTNGTMSFATPDGFGSVTLEGKDGPVTITAAGQTVHGLYGDLLVTSFDSGTGQLGYTYTLLDNVDHSGGAVHDDFAAVVTDADGDHSDGTLSINIADDAPVAKNDFDTVGNILTTDGNVITGAGTTDPVAGQDDVGADNALVSAIASQYVPANAPVAVSDGVHGAGFVIAGEHGTLTIYADGYYTYTRTNGDPLVADDKFTYTLTDGDGDPAPATLTINIYDTSTELDLDPEGENDNDVDEKGLPVRNIVEPAGTGEIADNDGTNDSDTSEHASGTMSFSTPDGFGSLTLTGKDGPVTITAAGQIVHGLYGDLLVTGFDSGLGQLSYTYTLLDNVDHSGGPVQEDFAVVVTDIDGDHSDGTLSIDIIDDRPIPLNDSYNVTEGQTLNVPAAGVLANDTVGADGGKAAVAAVLIGNLGGSLTLNADGSFSYTAPVRDHGVDGSDGDGPDVEIFTYTMKDADGSTATAQILINILDTGVNAQNDEYSVVEGQTLNVPLAGVLANDTVGADGGKAAVAGVLTGSLGGSLVLNPDGSFSYVAPVRDHGVDGSDGDGPDFEIFTYTMKDSDGSTATAQIKINITDTGASAQNDEYSVVEGQALTINAAGVLANDTVGVDGGKAAVPSVLTGSLGGSLTLNADGSFSYVAPVRDHGVDGSDGDGPDFETFTYTMRDADGSTSTGQIKINITDTGASAQNDEYTVVEGQSLNIGAAGVLTNDTVGADGGKAAVAAVLTGSLGGSLTLNADGSFSYTAPVRDHGVDGSDGDGPDFETFTYTMKDADGSTSTAQIKINITDTGASAQNDEYTVVEGQTLNIPLVGVLANDTVGADGGKAAVPGVLTGSLGGSLTLNADGSFSYTAPVRDHGVDGSDGDGPDFEIFTYTMRDADGSTSTAQIKINITDTGASAQNDEYNVVEGQTLNINAAGVLGNDTVGVDGGKAAVASVLAGSLGGSLTLNADGSFSYTAPVRDHGVDGSDGDGPDFETFTYTMKDADGSTSTAQIKINITDTGASAQNDEYTVVEGQTLNVPLAGVLANDTVGADGGKAAVAAVLTGSLGGSLTLNADGSFSYTAPVRDHGVDGSDGDGPDFETFTYTMKDADGSTSTAQIKINITDTGASAQNDEYTVVEGQTLNVPLAGVLANDTVGADGGKAAVAAVLTGSLGGSLTLNADGSFSYTAPVRDHGVDGSDGDGPDFETFTYTMKDADGSTSTAQIKINITDTGASAQNDEYSVVEGQTLNVPLAGVLANDTVGADGGKAAVPGVLAGSLGGSLTLNADGSFSYTAPVRDHGVDGSDGDGPDFETFTYTMKDADGSTSTAQIKINITDTGATAQNDEYTVVEGQTLNVPLAGVLANDTVGADGGKTAVAAALTGSLGGSLTLNADGSFSYTAPVRDHGVDGSDGDGPDFETFIYTMKDADGSTSTAQIKINITDTGATAQNDEYTVVEGQTLNVPLVGVLANDTVGADGGKAAVPGVLTGSLGGSLTLNADGSFSYTAPVRDHGVDGSDGDGPDFETFTYTMKDADGSTSTAQIKINITDTAPQGGTSTALVDDDALAGGNPLSTTDDDTQSPDPDASEKTFAGTLAHTINADGYGSVGFASLNGTTGSVGTETVTYSWSGNTLTATVTGGARNGTVLFDIVVTPTTGAYTLTLKDNVLHAAGGDENNATAILTYKVTDADGSVATGTLTITFDDDAPTAADDNGGSVNAGQTISANTVLTGVAGNDKFGADDAKTGGGVVGVLAGSGSTQSTTGINTDIVTALGTLKLQADGTYTYTAKANASGTDSFTYTIEDGDGDRTTAVLTFTVADQAQGTISGATLVYEDGIQDQNTGGSTPATQPLGITFLPADNEQLTSLTIKTLTVGWKIYDGVTLLATGSGADVVIDTTVHAVGNLKILPPADNADGDISLNIQGTLLDPNGGLTSTITGTLTVQRDAVADQPTNVQIIVSDSNDAGSNFAPSETGTVQVKATFGDYLDGSETHTVTVQLASGFTSGALSANGTLSGFAYTYNSGTGVVVFTVPNGTQNIDVTFAVTAPSGTIPLNPTFTATATATETTFAQTEPDLTNNTAMASASTGVPVERAISGTIVTNSNVTKQQLLLTVVDQSNPIIASANIFSLFLQGQQGSFLLDGGFVFDSDDQYAVAVESVLGSRDGAGTQVQLTDFGLQIGAGVNTGDLTGSGNVKLDDNDDAGGPNLTGYTAVITPDTGAVDQALTGSQDGTAANQTLSDGSANTGTFNMTYGAAGTDTLNGSNDADLLRGGPGTDTLNGNGGNDVLVFGTGDHIDGGTGIDILRVDDGAIALTKIEDGSVAGPLVNTVVNLEAQDIHNIESILITQEAIPEAGFGTTVRLDAKNVLDFTDANDTLYIVGNSGDKVVLGVPDGGEATWVDGNGNAGDGVTKFGSITVGGVTFDEYHTSSGGKLYVDAEITVQTE